MCMLNCQTFSHHKIFWAIYVIGPFSKLMDDIQSKWNASSCIRIYILVRAFIKFLSHDMVCKIIVFIGCCIYGGAGTKGFGQFPFWEQNIWFRVHFCIGIVLTVWVHILCIQIHAYLHSWKSALPSLVIN